MKEFYNKYKQPLKFLFFGTLTTVINLIIYYLFFKQLKYTNATSTIIAWFCSLIFSFITSKLFVFENNNKVYDGTIKEFLSFFSVRLSLGIFDLFFMLILVDLLGFNSTFLSLIMKVISNCLIGVINYFLSKKLIFSASNNKKDIKFLVIIFLCALLSSSYLFKKGLARGDDFYYHATLIYDLYKSALNNNFRYSINEYLLSNIGYGARLFYPPLFEFITVIIAITFKNYDLTLIGSIKIVIFLEYFFSGIFMFYFLKKIFKNKPYLALIGAIFYVTLPYRTTNDFDRSAYAEGLALTFIPLVFSFLYDILQTKYTFKSFLLFSISFSLVFLSHTISATYLVLFGIIFALFYFKNFISNLKVRKYRLYLTSSALIILGLIAFYLVPLISIAFSNDYIVSNKEAMSSTVKDIVNSFMISIYKCGFGTFRDVIYGVDKYQALKIFISLFLILLEFIINILFKKKDKEVISQIINLILNIIILIIFKFDITFVSAVIIYYVIYLVFKGINIKKIEIEDRFFKSIVVLFIITLAFMLCPFLFYLLPSYMHNIQFTFRLFSFLYFFISILVPLIISKTGLKNLTYLSYIFFIFVGFTQCSSKTYDYIYTIDDSILDNNTNGVGGWQKEYLPIEFYEKTNYIPANANSLYYKILDVFNLSENALEYQIDPIIYTGSGTISQNENTYIVDLKEASTIQFGKIYYNGYILKVTSNGTSQFIEVSKLDGLVSVNLEEGSYQIELIYVGTKANNIAKVITEVTIFVVFVMCIYYLCASKSIIEEYENKGYKKLIEED